MKHSIALLSGIAVISATLSLPAFAQGTPQTLSLMKVDSLPDRRCRLMVGSICIEAFGAQCPGPFFLATKWCH